MTFFSIVIPLFNKEKDIKKTLLSVLSQSFEDFEIIIVDDGSTDASRKVVEAIKDNRILLYSKKNEGVSEARNFGVEKTQSNYVVFLDADDYWYTNHLETINILIHKFPNNLWFASGYEKKRNKNLTTSMVSPILEKGNNWLGKVDNFFKYCFIDSLTNASSVCFNKSFYSSLGGFNTSLSHGEDIDLWIRAALQSSLVFSNSITSRHNLTGVNRSSKVDLFKRTHFNLNAFKAEEKVNPFLKKYLDLNRFSLAIQHKMFGDATGFKKYAKEIDEKNLNRKQIFLLGANKNILKILFKFQKIIEKMGIRLSSF